MGTEKCLTSDLQSGFSRMERVCAGEGFYQRQTLTGSPVWDCPSNSCVPQEALHKKQLKNAQRHFICHQSTLGEQREPTAPPGFFNIKPAAPALKEMGTVEDPCGTVVRQLTPSGAARPAHPPDDCTTPG